MVYVSKGVKIKETNKKVDDRQGNTLKAVKTWEAANYVHCKTSSDGASMWQQLAGDWDTVSRVTRV